MLLALDYELIYIKLRYALLAAGTVVSDQSGSKAPELGCLLAVETFSHSDRQAFFNYKFHQPFATLSFPSSNNLAQRIAVEATNRACVSPRRRQQQLAKHRTCFGRKSPDRWLLLWSAIASTRRHRSIAGLVPFLAALSPPSGRSHSLAA